MKLPKQENIVLDHRYWLGTFQDFSEYGNDGTPSGCHWEKRPDRHIHCVSGGYVQVADSPELTLLGALTLVVYAETFDAVDSATEYRLLLKRNVAGNFDFKVSQPNGIGLFVNGVTSWSGAHPKGHSVLIVALESGNKPSFYFDGVQVGEGANAETLVADSGDVYVGFGFGTSYPDPLKGALIYNTALTAEEIAQVHEWIMAIRTPTYQKKHFVFPSQISGREDGLVSAYDMQNVHGKIIDKTGHGNHGTVYGAINSPEGLWFQGHVGDRVEIPYNEVLKPSDQNTIVWSMKPHSLPSGTHEVISYGGVFYSYGYLINQLGAGIYIYWRSALNLFNAPGALVIGQKNYFALVNDNGNLTLYKDGVAIGTGAAGTNTVNNYTTYIGGLSNQWNVDATLGDISIYDRALSAGEVKTLYQKYAKLPIFIDDLKDANESVSSISGAGNYLENTNWQVGSGSWKISRDSLEGKTKGNQLLTDGDMEAAGTSAWQAISSTVLTKETVNPHGGNQVLRIAYGGTANPEARQDVFVVGSRYKISGWARSDGVFNPRIWMNGLLWSGTSSTDWQQIDISFTATGIPLQLYCGAAATGYVEFDDIAIYEIDAKDKVIECTSAGLIYQESRQAYGTWEFDLYKGADGNNTDIIFMGDVIGKTSATGQDGYFVRLDTLERVYFAELVNGTTVLKAVTANGYTSIATHYQVRITRRYDGLFTLYIKGGAFMDWTLVDMSGGAGTNPVTDNTTTSSRYVVLDLDARDKITNFRFYQGVVAP